MSNYSLLYHDRGEMEMRKTKEKKFDYYLFPVKLVIGVMICFGIIYVMPNLVRIITKIYEELL